jgi:hypothetical protein
MMIGGARREEVFPQGKIAVGVLTEGHLGSRIRLRCLVGLGRGYLTRRPGVHHEAEEALAEQVDELEFAELLEEYERWWCEVLAPAGLWIGAHEGDGACYGVWEIERDDVS